MMWFWNHVLVERATQLSERLAEMTAERNYWREKTEILLDSTLFRRGEVTTHVFSTPRPAAAADDNPLMRAMSALAHTEIGTATRPAGERE